MLRIILWNLISIYFFFGVIYFVVVDPMHPGLSILYSIGFMYSFYKALNNFKKFKGQ